MATFVKAGDKTATFIRKQWFPAKAKTFLRLADAKKWARKVEAEIKGGLVDSSVLRVLPRSSGHFREAR